jgi:hypothetical protein
MLKYNGWTNRETWLVNLWLSDYIAATQQDGLPIMPDDLEAYVDTLFDQHHGDMNGLLTDLLVGSIARIKYQEIADHANEGMED